VTEAGGGLMTGRGRTSAAAVVALVVAGALLAGIWAARYVAGQAPPRGAPTEEEARAIFAGLHRNIYRAFDRGRDELAIYDALALSVDGRLLDRIYNEVYEGLVLREEGGLVTEVRDVTIVRSDVLPTGDGGGGPPSFRVRCTWEVLSGVLHEGHEHVRLNEYEAVYTVALVEEGWRIVDDRILSQRRVPTLAAPSST
jgi:hypothetical protein